MQVGEAGAEVVDRQQHAFLLEQFEAAAQRFAVADQRRLGQLQLQPLRRPAIALAQLDDPFGEAAVAQLHRRDVHRDPVEAQPRRIPGRGLAAGLADHPVAQAHDLAAFLGDRNELGRVAMAVAGAVPAQQRFHRRRALARRVHQRLVHQRELLAVQRAMQRMLDLQAPLRAQQHVLAVVMAGVASGLLGRVHRRVGGAQQAVEVLAPLLHQRDADAGADLDHVLAAVQRLGQRRDQLARHVPGVARLGEVAQHHHELVAAETAEQVAGAQLLVHAGGRQLQQRVAGGVAEGIVDALEAVQVDEQHRQRGAALHRLVHRLLGLLAQQLPVRQAGQQVVVGQQLDALAGLAFAGDVAEQHHEARRQAVAFVQLDQHLHPDALPGRAVEAQVQLLRQAALGDAHQRGLERIARVLGVQGQRMVQIDGLLAQAMDAVALLGPLHAPGADLDLAATDLAQRRDAVEQLGAPADQGVGLALLGDVLHLAEHALDAAVGLHLRLRPHPQVQRRLAATHQLDLEVGRLGLAGHAPPDRDQLRHRIAAEQAQPPAAARRLLFVQPGDAQEFARAPHPVAQRIPGPAAHAGHALRLAQQGLLVAQALLKQLLLVDVGVRADHAQRAAVGGACDDAAAVQDPVPLPVLPAQAELAHIGFGAALEMRADRLAQALLVVAVDQRQQRVQAVGRGIAGVTEHPLPALGAEDGVAGDVPVPQPVFGAVQGDLPAGGAIAADRFWHAEGIGQQAAAVVAHRAQPAVQASPGGAGQGAGQHGLAAEQALAGRTQQLGVRLHGARQLQCLRCPVRRQRPAVGVQQDERRGERVLQQACDDALIHAEMLRFAALKASGRR
ncbi:hypothetical protein NB706_000616 [Xanthomonas sacchari]|nr:hypothetical protein [Xanthomonas sacchari]